MIVKAGDDMAVILSVGLQPWADAITGWIVAVLGFTVAVMIAFGVLRAWRVRLRPQIVIPDVKPDKSMPAEAVAGLSVQLRDTVRRALRRQGDDARKSEMETLKKDIAAGLVNVHGATAVKATGEELERTVRDSMATLSAGLRAVAPKQAEGLAAALELAVPDQHGWIVQISPIIRGVGADTRVGLCLEVATLGHAPGAVTTFWATSEALQQPSSDAARMAAIRELLHELVRPTSAWIAIQLVSRHLTHKRGWFYRLVLIRRSHQHQNDLTGLQLQLGGQLLLYATRAHQKFAEGFAYEALNDLERAAELLPYYFRPRLTQAAVYERLAWTHRRSGDEPRARRSFIRAVESYNEAEDLLAKSNGTEAEKLKANERLAIRRTKCRLLSCDPRYAAAGLEELSDKYTDLIDARPEPVYNAACLFAVAAACPNLPAMRRVKYERRAWNLLGHALLLSPCGGGPWSRMMTDETLDSLDLSRRKEFGTQLAQLTGGHHMHAYSDADRSVKRAMTMLGLTTHPAESTVQQHLHPLAKSPRRPSRRLSAHPSRELPLRCCLGTQAVLARGLT